MLIQNPKKPAFQTLAEHLEQRLRAGQHDVLTSITRMAAEFGVSYVTMWRAVHELARKGVLVVSKGRRVALAPGMNPQIEGGWESSSDHLYNKVKQHIVQGEYAVGKPLPKVSYFTVTERVSSATVEKALHRHSLDDDSPTQLLSVNLGMNQVDSVAEPFAGERIGPRSRAL